MKVTYYNHNSTKEKRNYTILNEKEESIGSLEGFFNQKGELIPIVRINPDFQKKGLGIGSWHKDDEFTDCEDRMSTN